MQIESITIGLPVSDLSSAVEWYRRVLDLPAPELEPAAGVVEFQVGSVWLQLGVDATAREGAEVVVRLGVTSASDEHARLTSLGVEVTPLEHVPGAVDYFDFTDPDGNVLSVYSEVD